MIGGNEEYGLTVARVIYPAYVLGGHAYVAVDDAGDVVFKGKKVSPGSFVAYPVTDPHLEPQIYTNPEECVQFLLFFQVGENAYDTHFQI